METDLIIVNEYCRQNHIDHSFIVLLYDEGLIDILQRKGYGISVGFPITGFGTVYPYVL